MLGGKGDAGINSLALQLATAKLKRSQPPKTAPPAPVSTVTENSGSSTSSGGRSSSGMASMMDEMAKTLARRRAQVEKKEPDSIDDGQSTTRQRAWEKSSTLPHKLSSSSNQNNNSATSNNTSLSGSESPKPSRKRFGSASEETILKQINGDSFSLPSTMELESFKEEILREMRCEIAKAKQEIIEAIKSEFNRR